MKLKSLEIELVKRKFSNKPDNIQIALKELNKTQVDDKNLHEIENAILLDYTGDFEMVSTLKVGDQTRQTHIRFRNVTEYETNINVFDQVYESEDAIFKGYLYKVDTTSI